MSFVYVLEPLTQRASLGKLCLTERGHRFQGDSNRVLPKRQRDEGSQEDVCSVADPSSISRGVGKREDREGSWKGQIPRPLGKMGYGVGS